MKTGMWTSILLLAVASGGAMAGDDDVIGYLGDQAITRAEVSDAVASQLLQVRQQEYDILSNGLEAFINQRLVEMEAEKRGVTPEQLMLTEVMAKVQSPTAEDIDKFYEENKARMGGRTAEEVSPDIERYLMQVEQQRVQQEFLDKLRSQAGVRILLEPPRVDVPIPAGEPSRGPADAAVVMVEFSDFQCPYCKRAHATVEQVLEEYGDRIRFVYRDYPLPNHPRATPAGIAARCAGEQDRYWEYHDILMSGTGDLSDANLESTATSLELDMEAFRSCVASGRQNAAVQAGLQDGARIGVTGTPAFFINGRHINGAQPLEVFRKVLDEELARAAGSGEGAPGAK